MNQFDLIPPATLATSTIGPSRLRFPTVWLLIGLLLLSLGTTRAEGPDDDYIAAYSLINDADAMNTSGKIRLAHAKYIEAWQALTQFKRDNPGWNPGIISYRLNYLAGKIADTVPGANNPSPAFATNVASPTTPSESLVSTSTNPAEAPAPKPAVTLIDAGSEPRTVLRLHPAVGDKQTVSMTMKMGMDMGGTGGLSPNMDIPAIGMNMDVEVKDISTNGEITYAVVYQDASVTAGTNTMSTIASAMNAALAGINGMSGTGLMTDRGIVKKMEMKLPPTAAPQLSQITDQMKNSSAGTAVALPEEAVGPGARWECHTKINSQGMSIDQTITYKLVSLDGDRLNIRSLITQTAGNQKISNPAMPTLKMDLTKMTANATGTTTVDLGKLLPVAATLAEKTETVMGMNIGQQKQTMDMKINMNLTIESK